MCVRYTITRRQQHIYYTRCRTGPDCNVGPETQHKGWAQMHSPLLLVRPRLLVFSKGWGSILFKFQHGKQRLYGRTSNKKALLDAFSLQAPPNEAFSFTKQFLKNNNNISWNITSTRSQLIPLEVAMFWSINWKNYLGHQIQEDFWVIITNH